MEKRRIVILDLLRGIAILLMVLLHNMAFHYSEINSLLSQDPMPTWVLIFGFFILWAGLFGMISGTGHAFTIARKYNESVDDEEGKMKALAEKFNDAKVNWMDGVTIEYDKWWFNVRPSNTEPYLRLNLEADTKELMEEKRDLVLDFIRS